LVVCTVSCGRESSDEPGTSSATGSGGNDPGEGSGGRETGGRSAAAGSENEGGRLAAAGAASEGGRAGAADSGELTLEDLFQAQCDAAVECCTRKQLGAEPNRCRAEFGWTALETKLKSGNVVLDPEALARCIAAYEQAAATCIETGVAAACRDLLAGTKPAGAECRDYQECDRRDGPVHCTFSGSAIGECRPLIHGDEGEACEHNCQNGTECSGNQGGEFDVPKVHCFEDEGLYCSTFTGTMACGKLRGVGEECDNATACGSGGRCRVDPSDGTRRCSLGFELGEECQTNDRAACADDLFCDGDDEIGVCRAYEFFKESVCE